jgi:trans-2,3-dihydro-3-hydroxyanthranilate isomerase
MRRRFVTLDVFTSRRFAGNPLAVVLDAEGLNDATLQTIAREFNLSETVFVFPPAAGAHRAQLRIFTPAAELPFAGHPTIGAAALLGRLDSLPGARELIMEEGIGPVRCTVEPIDADRGRVRFDLPVLPRELGPPGDVAAVAAALSLSPDDIGFDDFGPARWSAGVPLTFVPTRSLGAVRRCRVDLARFERLAPPAALFVFCRETVDPGCAFHARMFAPGMGVPEDPATGSAVAGFAGMLAKSGRLAAGDHAFAIEQGIEMGRPSVIDLFMTIEAGALRHAAIGGNAVVVAEGTIEA